jgi:gluconolactonase
MREVGRGLAFPEGPIALATDNTGGSIQRVDLDTGDIDTVYTHWGEQPITSTNDIVFDPGGWFYFVDTGSGAICYAHPDGSAIDRAASGLEFPNGMGLSPDGGRLYASETYSGRLCITSSGRGKLYQADWPFPGLRLHFAR